MTVNTGVPTTLRRPQTFHRFVYQQGGRSLTPLPQRTVMVGTFKGGTATAGVVYAVDDAPSSDALFGVGQHLSLMNRKAIETCGTIGFGPQLFAVGVAENAAGVARVQTFTLTGTATAAGNLNVRIAGRSISVPVSLGDTAATVATALNVATNAMQSLLPVTSTVAAAVTTCTAVAKGVWGADISFTVDSVPAGLTCVTAQATPGSGAQDETAALAALAGIDYDTIALENHNTTAIALGLAHVTVAWGISEKKWRWLVYGDTGSIGTATTIASAANDKAMVVANCERSPSLCAELATGVAIAITAKSRPNANWDGQELPLYPPPDAFAFTPTQQETALAAGITPLVTVVNPNTRVTKANTLSIVKMVTTQTTQGGQPFEVLRDLAVPRAGAFIARQLDAKYAERFGAAANPDGVLLDDDAIPRVRDMIAAVLYACQDAKIITGVDADLALLVVEKDPSAPGRLNVDVTYHVVVGLHQVAFVHRVTL